jgi:predicted permease
MGTLIQDLRYAFRMLAKNPGFAFVAILTLALGIGANTAIFSVVNAVLLRPLPYKDSSQLLRVWATDQDGGSTSDVCSYPEFTEWRAQSHSFQQVAAFRHHSYNLAGGDRPERIVGLLVSEDLLNALQISPVKGRSFLPQEFHAGADHVVLLTDALWQRRFAGDPNLIGKTVRLNDESYTVIGILPPQFVFTPDGPAALLAPLVGDPDRGHGYLNVIARLKPEVNSAKAQSEMNGLARRIQSEFPKQEKGRGIRLESLQASFVGDARPVLLIFLGSVGLVLLIACANVANLFLARTSARQKEFAVRASLGAGRARLLRQLLTESVIVALAGGALGLLLAIWGTDALATLVRRNFPNPPFPLQFGPDVWVLGFTLIASVVTGLFAGLAPAAGASLPDLNQTLKEGSRGLSGGLKRTRLQSALVVSEVGLALVLLIGAGLMIKSLLLLEHVDSGLHAENILTADFSLYGSKYVQSSARAAFFQQLVDRVQRLPGVKSAALAADVPLTGNSDSSSFSMEGQPDPAPNKKRHASYNIVSPAYFQTLGIPLLKGRDLANQDNLGTPLVVVINQSMARHFWPDQNPVGRRVSTDDKHWYTIVGVAADVRDLGLKQEPRPQIFISYLQDPFLWPYLSLLVRTDSEPLKLSSSIQEAVWSLDKDQPISNIHTMEEILSVSVAQPRVTALMLAIFAGLALVMAAVGIYGVIAFAVTVRTHEMGVRMALGASRQHVLKLVVGRGLGLALLGVGIGLAGAFALTRFLSTLLYGVGASDPMTFVAVSLFLLGVAAVASYIPARRATKVDPMVALRYE